MSRPYLIVGASLAGLRAAESLRKYGYMGEIVLVGDELHRPYDRPPLSKAMLTGELEPSQSELPEAVALDVTWKLGSAARSLDLDARSIKLANGEELPFEKLLITTGTRARLWHDEKERQIKGVYCLRTRDDAANLRKHISATQGRVIIIGAGFIGCEIASVLQKIGRSVTVIERSEIPLANALGSYVGTAILKAHRDGGVDVRTATEVRSIDSDERGHFTSVSLGDGTKLTGDLCIVALGAVRNSEWLEKTEICLDERGVHTDEKCQVLARDGSVLPGLYAAGDIACWPSVLYDGKRVAIEHWSNAVEQARAAAHNMAMPESEAQHYDYLPTFWSNQAGRTIKSVGLPSVGEQVVIAQGSLDSGRFVAVYGSNGKIVAAVSVDHGRFLDHYAQLVKEKQSFPPEMRTVEPSTNSDSISFSND